MTTPLDHYVETARQRDRSYPPRDLRGSLTQIFVLALIAGALAGVAGGADRFSLSNAIGGLAGIHFFQPGTQNSMYADTVAGFLLGAVAWAVPTWLGLRRLVLGIALVLVIWTLWTILVLGAVTVVNMNAGMSPNKALAAMQATVKSGTPVGVILTLVTFSGIWFGVWASLKLFHRQSLWTLLSPRGRMRWGEFGGGLALAAAFWVLSLLLGVAVVGLPVRTHLPLTMWLASLTPLALLVFLQASAEELIFRGYMLQQLAARWRSPLVWALIPSLLFGALHYASGSPIGIGWLYVLVTVLFGLASAIMVWRTGALAVSMGVHTGMNFLSLTLAGVSGVVDGTKLYAYNEGLAPVLFTTDGICTVLLLGFVMSPWCPWGRRAVPA